MEPEFFITNAAEKKIFEILSAEEKNSYFV